VLGAIGWIGCGVETPWKTAALTMEMAIDSVIRLEPGSRAE